MEKELERLTEIQEALRPMFESAIAARDAAQQVCDQKFNLDMRITKMQTEIQEAELRRRRAVSDGLVQ